MKDDDVEALLASMRPVGPRPDLRARILSRHPARPAWPWALAAAAVLVLTALLQAGTAAARNDLRASTGVAAPDPESELMAALRGAGLSENEARLIAMTEQVQLRIEQNRPTTGRAEP